MSNDKFKVKKGIKLETNSTASDADGEIRFDGTNIKYYSGGGEKTVVDSSTTSGTNTGDVTLAAVGSSPNANGASLSGQQLSLQPADATNPGVVTTGAQTFAGAKTFSSTIVGDISGNAATATSATTASSATNATNATNTTNIAITDDTTTNATMYPTWVTTTTGNLPAKVASSKLTFNPSTGTLTTTTFSGALSGNATTATSATSATSATDATNATNTAITDDTSTNATMYPTWVTANTGNLPQKVTSSKLTFNPSTGALSTTALSLTTALPIASGGTNNGSLAVTAGGTLYTDGTKIVNVGAGTSGQVLQSNGSSAPTWVTAASGGKNYITNNEASTDTTGWATYADAAGTSPVNGVDGSPNSTWTRTTSSPLRGAGSFLFTKNSGASRQGEGVAFDFTIDDADKGKVLQISFDYSIASGTYVDDAMSVWIYDKTNLTLIQPSPYLIKNHTLAAERFAAEFQTSSSSTSYRLIFHVGVATDSSNTLKFDNISVGPNAKLYGSPVTDWQSYTPTATSFTSGWTGKWRRVGDSMELDIRFDSAGAQSGTLSGITIPSGYTIDTAKLSNSSTTFPSSFPVTIRDSGAATYFGFAFVASTTTFSVNVAGSAGSYIDGNSVTATVPMTWASGDNLSFKAQVPISGWSSSVVMSSDADTRVVAMGANVQTPTGTLNGSTNITKFGTKAFDTHNAYDTSTGLYTVPVPGKYKIYGDIEITGTFTAGQVVTVRVYKNGTGGTQVSIGSNKAVNSVTTNYATPFMALVDCVAGDTLGVYSSSDGSTLSYSASIAGSSLFIERISGPAQIAASESVNCRAYLSADQTGVNPNASAVKINLNAKEWDSHGAWDTSTYKFTAPISGKYQVNANIYMFGANITGNVYAIQVKVNGGTNIYGTQFTSTVGTAFSMVFSDIIRLTAGQTLELYMYGQGNNSVNTITAPGNRTDMNYISIARIGNY